MLTNFVATLDDLEHEAFTIFAGSKSGLKGPHGLISSEMRQAIRSLSKGLTILREFFSAVCPDQMDKLQSISLHSLMTLLSEVRKTEWVTEPHIVAAVGDL